MNLLQWPFIQTVVRLILRHPICGVIIIPVFDDGRIALVRRRDNNCWGFPGGMVEWGEDIVTALHRELQEETGLKVSHVGRLVGVYSSPQRDPRVHSICVVVEARVTGLFTIEDHREIAEAKAFVPNQIPIAELTHDHGRLLTHYQQGMTTLA